MDSTGTETATTVPTDPRTPPAPPAERIAIDIGCVECSYNLRGLTVGGRCPECGYPVTKTPGLGWLLLRTTAPVRMAAWGGVIACAAPILNLAAGQLGLFETRFWRMSAWSFVPLTLSLWLLPTTAVVVMALAARRISRIVGLAERPEVAGPLRLTAVVWQAALPLGMVPWGLLVASETMPGVFGSSSTRFVEGSFLVAWLYAHLAMPAVVAAAFSQVARRLGNLARMPKRANWFRSVGRMLLIGGPGLVLPVAILLSVNLASKSTWVVWAVALSWAFHLGFLLTGAVYFVLASFWLSDVLGAIPPESLDEKPASPAGPPGGDRG
jgi:hypothetical protein